MTYASSSYLALFKAVSSIEDALNYGQTFTNALDDEIEELRKRIEIVVDKTIEYAAIFGWPRGLRWGGFNEMFTEFNDLTERLAAYQ
jgi:hypothetical protein